MDTSTKQCAWCGEYKPLDAFYSQGVGHLTPRCKQCQSALYHASRGHGPTPSREGSSKRRCDMCGEIKPVEAFPSKRRSICTACTYPGSAAMTHRCTRCGIDKPFDQFNPSSKDPTKPRAWCRDCTSVYGAARRAARPYTPKSPKPPAPPLTEKRCNDCGIVKPVSEFHRHLATYAPYCKACIKIRQRAQYLTHRAERLERGKEWAKMHPDTVKASKHKYQVKWTALHLDHIRTYARERKQRLRAVYTDYENRRRARKIAATIAGPVNRAAIIARDASTCYLCGKVCSGDDLTLDHIIPLVRGGPHTPDNLRVACRSCNSKKATKLLDEMGA